MITDQGRRRVYARQNQTTGLTARQWRRVQKKCNRAELCTCWISAFDPIENKAALARWLAGSDAWVAAGVDEHHIMCVVAEAAS